MKLSKSDLLLLNNFASINESIHFYEGALQSTVANSRNHFAFATFEEEFPKEFCIFDSNHFISVYSLVNSTGDTVLEFPEDKQHLVIKSDKTSQDIRFVIRTTKMSHPKQRRWLARVLARQEIRSSY